MSLIKQVTARVRRSDDIRKILHDKVDKKMFKVLDGRSPFYTEGFPNARIGIEQVVDDFVLESVNQIIYNVVLFVLSGNKIKAIPKQINNSYEALTIQNLV